MCYHSAPSSDPSQAVTVEQGCGIAVSGAAVLCIGFILFIICQKRHEKAKASAAKSNGPVNPSTENLPIPAIPDKTIAATHKSEINQTSELPSPNINNSLPEVLPAERDLPV